MMIGRRNLFGAGLALLPGVSGDVQATPGFKADTDALIASLADLTPPAEEIDLWPSDNGPKPNALLVETQIVRPAEGFLDRSRRNISRPRLAVFPAAGPKRREALLIIPGGAYQSVGIDREGWEPARLFARSGYNVFVLTYRLPGEGWRNPTVVPLADAQRAVRTIRSLAPRFGFAPDRVSVLGFSAGGHLAASLATRSDEQVYEPLDATDALSARPVAVGLVYPVITMEAAYTNEPSLIALLGPSPDAALVQANSLETRVDQRTPPCFLLACQDDVPVPVANTYRFAQALAQARVGHETHVFSTGGHAFGIRRTVGTALAVWPSLFLTWLAGSSTASST